MANKSKNHKGAAKRIQISGSGKMMHRGPYSNHNLSKKSASRKRNMAQSNEIEIGIRQKVRRMLGI